MSAVSVSPSQPPVPDVHQLANGLSVSLLSQPWLRRAAVCVRVGAGSHDEPLAYPGLAHFLEHMLFLESVGLSGDQRLMPFVQACGGQVNATTQARHCEYFFEVPAEQLGAALTRLMLMLARPLLSEVEQVREREVVHAEFVARSQDSDTLLSTALGQALAAGHRCADFLAGNRDTLPVEDGDFQHALRAFHQRFYYAANCQLSLVGPQSAEELYALAECMAGVLPERPVDKQCSLAEMLPLRFQHARVLLPKERSSVHVGFALELPATRADDALALVQYWLMNEQPGGLVAELRQVDVGCELHVRAVYAEAGQVLLHVAVAEVASPMRALAFINDWLGFVNQHADLANLLANYRTMQAWQQASLGPLSVARCGAKALAGEESECDLQTLHALLGQMLQVQRRVVLSAQAEPLPPWPAAVFPLYMQRQRPLAVPGVSKTWCMPGTNRLLDTPVARGPLGLPAVLRWLPGPAAALTQPIRQAVWLARLSFAEALGSEVLLRLAKCSLHGVIQQAAQLGIQLQLNTDAANLDVRIQGHGQLLPRVIEVVMRQLAEPDEGCWQTAFAVPGAAAGMPIRVLLAQSSAMLEPLDARSLSQRELRAGYRTMQVDALGVGFGVGQAQAVSALMAGSEARPTTFAALRAEALTRWHQLPADGEAALLLFCPQPDLSATSEACWRVLAHLHQGAFYQRIRSELQLGYAVFCQYRQIQGRRGLLFGVQSPHLSAPDILEQIRIFLQARTTSLEQLSEAELSGAGAALISQWQLQAATVEGLAEQCWQAHLANISDVHAEAVLAQLERPVLDQICAAQRALAEGVGGRFVLSNHGQSA